MNPGGYLPERGVAVQSAQVMEQVRARLARREARRGGLWRKPVAPTRRPPTPTLDAAIVAWLLAPAETGP